jgi:kynurenine formamidase
VTTSETSRTKVEGWEQSKGWGWIWGETDEVGAVNAVTPASILHALSIVSQGRVYDLGITIDRQSFTWSGHVGTEVIMFRTPEGILRHKDLGFTDREGESFHTSMVVLSDHSGTQLDALSHATFGPDCHWYNGYTVEQYTGDFGPQRAGAEKIPPIIVPASLIDVPGYLGLDELDPSFAVGPDLIAAILDAQRVDIEPGDAVMIRTGTLRNWGDYGENHSAIQRPNTAGITLKTARWLVEEKGALLIASDTTTVEVVPAVDGDIPQPVHKYLLVDQGVNMGEFHYLEDLAADNVYRFCYIALTPKVRGTTAGFAMRPIAVV